MKRQILHGLGIAALATGGLLTVAGVAHADSGSSNGNQITYIHQDTTTICGNAIAIESVVQNSCDGRSGISQADLDRINGILDLALEFDGADAADDAGQWFDLASRTWS
jgi:hypothetical protein